MAAFCITVGILGWLIGFLRAGSLEKGRLFGEAFVRPPFLVYLLCGFSRASNIPKGVVALRSLMSQLLGVVTILYGVASAYLVNRYLSLGMLFLALAGFGIVGFCLQLYKRYPYIPPAPQVE